MAIFNDQARVAFVCVPFAEGDQIRDALRKAKGGRVVASETYADAVKVLARESKIDYLKLAVIRCPLERFAAAYLTLASGLQPREDAAILIKQTHATVQSHARIYDSVDEGFRQFVKIIGRHPSMRATMFRPQAHFLCDNKNKVIPTRLIRRKDIFEQWPPIAEELGVSPKLLPLSSITFGIGRPKGKDYHQTDDLLELYDKETTGIIRNLYREDYEAFNF